MSDTENSVESMQLDGEAEEYRRSRSRNMIDRRLSCMGDRRLSCVGAIFNEFRHHGFRNVHSEEARGCWFVLGCFLMNNALKIKTEDKDVIWQVTKPLTMSESESCCRAWDIASQLCELISWPYQTRSNVRLPPARLVVFNI